MAIAPQELQAQVQEIASVLCDQRAPSSASRIPDALLGEIVRTSDRLLEEIGEAVPGDDFQTLVARALLQSVRRLAAGLNQERYPDQAWFWTPEWQRREREADAQIAAGLGTRYDSDEAFLASLD